MKKSIQMLCVSLAWGVLLVSSAQADEGRERGRSAPQLALYQQECGSCHLAYPAGLLPARSWTRLMQGLDQHFGVNASLDDESVKTLSTYLTRYASTRTETPPQDRITQARWFVRKHHDFTQQDWLKVKGASNCAACHTGAAQGDFEEDRVRLPDGLRAGWKFWRRDDD